MVGACHLGKPHNAQHQATPKVNHGVWMVTAHGLTAFGECAALAAEVPGEAVQAWEQSVRNLCFRLNFTVNLKLL